MKATFLLLKLSILFKFPELSGKNPKETQICLKSQLELLNINLNRASYGFCDGSSGKESTSKQQTLV